MQRAAEIPAEAGPGLEEGPGRAGTAAFLVMMSGSVSQSQLFSLLPPLLPVMARSFGGNGAFIAQMIFALASLGLMVISITSGLIARAIGLRRMLILSVLLYGLAGVTPAVTSNVTIILCSRVVTGGGSGLLTTACTMLLARCYAGAARNRALGYQTAIGSISGILCVLIGGVTVASLGWHVGFLLYGIFALPVALLAIVGVPSVPRPATVAHQGFGAALALIWPVCLAACVMMMVALLVGSDVPFALTAIGVTRPLTQSVVVGLSSVLSTVTGLLFGRMQASLGIRRTFTLGILSGAVGMAAIGLGGDATLVGLGCAMVGIGVGICLPHFLVLATTLVPEPIRGHSIGLLTTSMYLGGFLYPLPLGRLQSAFGLRGALVAIAIMLAIGAAALTIGRRSRLAGSS